MSQLAPIVQDYYSDGQRAYIAGYLIWYRSGVLQALASCSSAEASVIPDWQGPCVAYYKAAEAITRQMLYELGYPVQKDEEWGFGE